MTEFSGIICSHLYHVDENAGRRGPVGKVIEYASLIERKVLL